MTEPTEGAATADTPDVKPDTVTPETQPSDQQVKQPDALAAGEPAETPFWNEKWREEIAGQDEKELKLLERYNSPQEIWKKARELEKKLSSGKIKAELPKNPTPEQLAEFRQQNGIPESPEGYELNLDEGYVVGEDDKPLWDKVKTWMHEQNASPAEINRMGNVYYKLLQEQQEQLVTQNKQAFADSRAELKQEWGADYNQIFAHMGTFLEQYPALKAVLNSGVGPNKIAHGYNADVLREIASLAKIVDPAPSIVGATMESKLETVEGELSKLTSMMGDHDSEYWKGPNAEKNQKRFRELTEIKQTFKK